MSDNHNILFCAQSLCTEAYYCHLEEKIRFRTFETEQKKTTLVPFLHDSKFKANEIYAKHRTTLQTQNTTTKAYKWLKVEH